MILYIVLIIPSVYLLRKWLISRRRTPVGPTPQVSVASGKIEGCWSFSQRGRQFAAFLGVPYAKPPTGSLRFLRPEPVEPWEGVRRCVKGTTFIQRNIFRPGSPKEGREDGLTLNVYSHNCCSTKAVPSLPVLVFLHGGGYVSGSGSRLLYGPELFMDREVVLVCINFRLSVLGGLYIPGGKAPGNQMMRDQVLGLQWVQENISKFGGDPKKVTIFGESAGGMSVMNHVLSPMSAGLFSAAIAQSGSPLGPFVGIDKHPAHYSRKLAEKLGVKQGASSEEMLQFLQELPADRIQGEFNMFEEFVRAPMPFKPIVDGGLVDDPFLPEEPLELLKKGKWNKVPLIIGTNKNEGLLIKGFFQRDGGKYGEAKEGWDNIGPLAFFHREKDEVSEEEKELCQQYRRKHFGDLPWSGEGQTGEALVRMYGDLLFHAPADQLVKALTKDAGQPSVFHYLYSHQGPLSLYDLFNLRPWQLATKIIGMKLGLEIFPSRDGVCHADELFMMFKPHAIPVPLVRSDDDRRVSECLLDTWTNFATHHDPTPSSREWKRFDLLAPKYYEIGSKGNTMAYSKDHEDRMVEWEGIWGKVPPTMRHMASKTWEDNETYLE